MFKKIFSTFTSHTPQKTTTAHGEGETLGDATTLGVGTPQQRIAALEEHFVKYPPKKKQDWTDFSRIKNLNPSDPAVLDKLARLEKNLTNEVFDDLLIGKRNSPPTFFVGKLCNCIDTLVQSYRISTDKHDDFYFSNQASLQEVKSQVTTIADQLSELCSILPTAPEEEDGYYHTRCNILTRWLVIRLNACQEALERFEKNATNGIKQEIISCIHDCYLLKAYMELKNLNYMEFNLSAVLKKWAPGYGYDTFKETLADNKKYYQEDLSKLRQLQKSNPQQISLAGVQYLQETTEKIITKSQELSKKVPPGRP